MKAIKNCYHFLLALLGAILYGYPSRNVFVMGVTGTKGKTTLVELLSFVFDALGYKTAFISSVHVKVGDLIEKNITGNSMPGRFFIQKFLRRAADAGCRFVFLEVTSQGVLQSRHRFIDFDAAVFTNLEPEHIEAHGSFEKYRQAKIDFFRYVSDTSRKKKKYFFINDDDENAAYFSCVAEEDTSLYSAHRMSSATGKSYPHIAAELKNHLHPSALAAVFVIATELLFLDGKVSKSERDERESRKKFEVAHEKLIHIIKTWQGVPGRMEVVQKEPFQVIVDYAHTPNSLEFVYESAKPKSGRLICVLGAAGGGRDKWKRPKLGGIAAKYCDEIVLADEDPYDEDPRQILAEIKSGISDSSFPISRVHEIPNRKEAIRKAISLAKGGDAIIVTGKGSEPFIHLAHGEKMPWNEREVVEEMLRAITK